MPPHGKPLARAQASQPYHLDGKKYTLTTRLEVTRARIDNHSRTLGSALWYEARFSLRADDENRGKNVGHLYAYAVDKTKQDSVSIAEILQQPNESSELSIVLQALYAVTGAVKRSLRDHAAELQQDHIMLIDGVVLNKEFHGKGLAKLAVEAFHSLLPTLPNGFDWTGTIVLCPAASGEENRKDNGKSDVEIEKALIRSYEKVGYEVWLKGEEHKVGSVTVMGRVIETDDDDDEEDED